MKNILLVLALIGVVSCASTSVPVTSTSVQSQPTPVISSDEWIDVDGMGISVTNPDYLTYKAKNVITFELAPTADKMSGATSVGAISCTSGSVSVGNITTGKNMIFPFVKGSSPSILAVSFCATRKTTYGF